MTVAGHGFQIPRNAKLLLQKGFVLFLERNLHKKRGFERTQQSYPKNESKHLYLRVLSLKA